MTTIPSRYNFVPLSDQIFFPDWAAQVSQDVPFTDGICGSLRICITAESPIYIRNGGAEQDEVHEQFFQVLPGTKQYAINGSTVKGMLRNIIEIASFAKLRQEKTDHHLSYRDLYYGKYTSRLTDTTSTGARVPRAQAGWLTEGENGEWHLKPCRFSRVELKDLEEYYSDKYGIPIDLHSHTRETKNTADEKYNKWQLRYLDIMFDPGPLKDEKHDCNYQCGYCRDNPTLTLKYRKAANLGTGETRGRIVMTGQPATWEPGRRHVKHMEFIFYPLPGASREEIPLSVKENFIAAHSSATGKANAEWRYWRSKLEQGRAVPVFYHKDNSGNILEMGLAMMFRVLYRHPVGRLIENRNPAHLADFPLDLAETMFGRTGDDAHSLRGRVSIEPLLVQDQAQELDRKTTILGSPRLSYYPNYIEQPHVDRSTWKIQGEYEYKTCEDEDAKARGWKRYPVPQADATPDAPDTGDSRSSTSFIPLAEDVRFCGDIHIHNLRTAELGALVWALTWGGEDDKRHNIGMAKPYGYGVIRVEIIEQDLALHTMDGNSVSFENLAQYMQQFAALMQSEIPAWEDSEQITELLAMADPERSWDHDRRQYPQGPRQFASLKKNKKVLRRHSASI